MHDKMHTYDKTLWCLTPRLRSCCPYKHRQRMVEMWKAIFLLPKWLQKHICSAQKSKDDFSHSLFCKIHLRSENQTGLSAFFISTGNKASALRTTSTMGCGTWGERDRDSVFHDCHNLSKVDETTGKLTTSNQVSGYGAKTYWKKARSISVLEVTLSYLNFLGQILTRFLVLLMGQ